jgi:hypothetical protein
MHIFHCIRLWIGNRKTVEMLWISTGLCTKTCTWFKGEIIRSVKRECTAVIGCTIDLESLACTMPMKKKRACICCKCNTKQFYHLGFCFHPWKLLGRKTRDEVTGSWAKNPAPIIHESFLNNGSINTSYNPTTNTLPSSFQIGCFFDETKLENQIPVWKNFQLNTFNL